MPGTTENHAHNAMADAAREINDHYMSITEEELAEAVDQKMLQAMERMQPH